MKCLDSADYKDVYEPNEDTYLLIDALNLESRHFLSKLEGDAAPRKVIEIGSGSSAVINSLVMLLKRDGS